MSDAPLPLAQLTRDELLYLRRAVAGRQLPAPISRVALDSVGKGSLFARLGPLAAAGPEASIALIDLALAAGAGGTAAASTAAAVLACTVPRPELLQGAVRATTAVLLDLLGGAQEQVVIVGYEFNHGAVIFQTLHKAMRDRGVKVAIFLDVRPVPSPKTNLDAYVALQAATFARANWPFGAPFPTLWYWRDGCSYGSKSSVHAKCVVVDDRHVLIGSANFTRRGHQRNLEIGVQLDDRALARALVHQLETMAGKGLMVKMPPLAAPEPPPVDAEDDGDARGEPAVDAAGLAAELLVSASAVPFFTRLVAAGVPVPEVGEDVEGEGGEVLGSAELTWEAAQVAVLLPEQEGSRKKLEAAGWTCFGVDLDDAAFGRLVELVGRVG